MNQLKALFLDLDVHAYRLGRGQWAVLLMPIIYPQCWANIHYRLTRAIVYHFPIPVLKHVLLCRADKRCFQVFCIFVM